MQTFIKIIISGFALMNFSGLFYLMGGPAISLYTFYIGFVIIILGLILNPKDMNK